MNAIDADLASAFQYYHAGQLARAEQVCRRILQAAPQHADALHLLGLILLRGGRVEPARTCMVQAVSAQPDFPEAHSNLGNIYQEQGNLPAAVACYREALRINPRFAGVHNNLGAALQRQGLLAEAVASYREALRLKPDYAEAGRNLVAAERELQKRAAAHAAPAAADADARQAGRLNSQGTALFRTGKFADAARQFREAIRLAPEFSEAHANLGAALYAQDQFAEAAATLRHALTLKPDSIGALKNLGATLHSQGKLTEAVACYRQALRVDAADPEAYFNLGISLEDLGQREESAASYRRAIELRPDHADAHRNLGLLLLLMGQFAAGWPEYEWRRQSPDFSAVKFPHPVWDGGALAGQTIMLTIEQGWGDVLQFVRYAPLVKARGASVAVNCPPALSPLLSRTPGIDWLPPAGPTPGAGVAGAPTLPSGPPRLIEFDVQASLLSLPGILGTTLANVPDEVPYLFADPQLVERWQGVLARWPGFKIGIAWQGSRLYRRDALRSIPLACFAPLAKVPGVHLISLQKGEGTEQIAAEAHRMAVAELGPQLDQTAGSFMDTAAVMKNLDLVITSDTAIAHLAGGLGVPVWVAIPFLPDWRWLLDRDDSPWYPTMRLFRQSQPGDWQTVFARMAESLTRRLLRHGQVTSVPELMQEAFDRHQAGNFLEAEQLYRQSLEIDPHNVDALHLLGLVALQTGRPERAARNLEDVVRRKPDYAEAHYYLGRALLQLGRTDSAMAHWRQTLALKPTFAQARSSLAAALQAAGDFAAAEACWRAALELAPGSAEAYVGLANALRSQGKLADAVASYRQALQAEPRDYRTLNSLGVALMEQGLLQEAIATWRQALAIEPACSEAHYNVGTVLQELGDLAGAIAAYREALRLQPGSLRTMNNLGLALLAQGDPEQAVACLQELIRLHPHCSQAHNNLGFALLEQGRLAEAVASFQHAVREAPDYVEAHCNLGHALKEQGNFAAAIASYRRALRIQPDSAEAHKNLGMTLILTGDWEQAWAEYEWRWQTAGYQRPPFVQPLWDGSPLAGRTILLTVEQGLGDVLQFVRYAPLVKARGGRVAVYCPGYLSPLLSRTPGIDWLTPAEPAPGANASGSSTPASDDAAGPPAMIDFDVQLPLLSLPAILGTTLANVPAEVPYLFADPQLVEQWRGVLAQWPGFKIGIAWQGSRGYRRDKLRSIPLACFGPLAQVPGVHLISLQKGEGTDQIAGVVERMAVADLGPQLDQTAGSFMDTAAVMKNLDLVITSDTAIAHLAGGLGVPVWLATPWLPDWRWLLDREDSPWYPTMRLFRQSEPGDWHGVFQRMTEALRQQLAGGSRQPAPAKFLEQAHRYHQAGDLEQAEKCYLQVLRAEPQQVDALHVLGLIAFQSGRTARAREYITRAVQVRPDFAEAHGNLALVLEKQGHLEEAAAAWRRALELKPEFLPAYTGLGVTLHKQGKLDEAVASFRQALQLAPDFAPAHSNLLYTLQYVPGMTLAALADAHREFARQHAAPLRATWKPHDHLPDPDRPLRVGLISADFMCHPVSYFLIGALENFDPAQVQVLCYSTRHAPDAMTRRCQRAATTWRDVAGWSHAQLSDQVRADQVDILIDLAGHSSGNRLLVFARKPAPVQISWIGYEGTTGLGAIDYVLGDRYVIPLGAEPHYAEQVLRMPHGYVCYDPPAQAPAVGPPPAATNEFVTFCSLNNPAKVTPEVVTTWANVLRSVPASRLILQYRGFDDACVQSRYLAMFAEDGVPASRLDLRGPTGYAAYLATYNEADIALDPFPFAGGATTCDALWMGVPVITCPGETFASRHALSYLSNIGLTETVARNLDEYVTIARDLAADLARLKTLRSGLRRRMAASPLCDARQFATDLTGLLRGVWRQFCASHERTDFNAGTPRPSDPAIGRDGPALAAELALAMRHHQAGNFAAAERVYQRILSADPQQVDALHILGLIAFQSGRIDMAREYITRAVQVRPDFATAQGNLALVLQQQGNLAGAAESWQQALRHKPDYVQAHVGLGVVLHERGQLPEAIDCCQRALRLQPDFWEAHINLGLALREQGKLEQAAASLQRAVQLKPGHANAHNSLGNVLRDQGRLDEALASYRQALQHKPEFALGHSNLLYAMQYRAGVTLAELAAAHAEFDRQHAAPLRADWRAHDNPRDADRVLRVGFVSADFACHPVGYFLIRALENLDPAQVQILCYSTRTSPDEMTGRFRAVATAWYDVARMSDTELAEQVRRDRVDILIDLAGHTSGNRLLVFARHPAPVQISWIGYEGTTGLRAMDYILADRYLIPREAEQHYVEQVLRLPQGYVCYDPSSQAPPVSPLPALAKKFVTFCSLNNPAKITPQVVSVWASLLRGLPQSRLILQYRGLDDPFVRDRYLTMFAEQSVAAGQLDLRGPTSYAAYLATYGEADIALDPFPFAGGVTTCEALWMGVPVVTCPGETFAGRHSLSHLANIGLTEAIAGDLEEYVAIARGLAGDLPRLATLRAGLRARMAASPLCDGRRFAGDLTNLLRTVWREYCVSGQRIKSEKAATRGPATRGPS